MALNVIALISGGKDSMYSMLHCIHQGHRIVALANLHPIPNPDPTNRPPIDDEDLNSFMFQTAGHSIIPLYAQALQLPLYRRSITGTAQHTSKDYTPSPVSGDETEDILALLAEVKRHHPEADAVSTGAILSTYQRTRVESVALRLGLTPLAYLWQYPVLPGGDESPAALLRHMRAVGMDVRIVKVASGGLDDSFLWANLCEERTIQRVLRAVERFGGSVLGEGGEFETLVLGGPSPLWKGRLVIEDGDIATVKAGGGEAFLSFSKGSVEMREGTASPSVTSVGLYDKHMEFILSSSGVSSLSQKPHSGKPCPPQHRPRTEDIRCSSFESDGMLYVNNIHSGDMTPIGPQASKVCKEMLEYLAVRGLDSSHVVHATILLRRMSDFASFNSIYGQMFQHPLPPSRVTIACGDGLPPSTDLSISIIADAKSAERQGLHVQTRSYWAPANIGPYSQARSIPCAQGHSFVYVAGQIPLVPASMERYEPERGSDRLDFAHSAALSLQHLWRIGVEQKVGFWTGAVAYLAPSDDFEHRAKIALQLWIEAHRPPISKDGDDEDEDDVDVWDQRNLGAQTWVRDEDQSRPLPDLERLTGTSQDLLPPGESHATPGFFAVEVEALPRDCAVEWQSAGLVSHASCQRYEFTYSNNSDNADQCRAIRALDSSAEDIDDRRSGAEYMEISEQAMKQDHARQTMKNKLSGKHVIVYDTADFFSNTELKAHVIPCRRIIGNSGRELAAAAIVQDVVR